MVNEADPLVNKFISVPREMGSLNCAAFVAGVIKGVLDGAGFVSAHCRSCVTWPSRQYCASTEPPCIAASTCERSFGAERGPAQTHNVLDQIRARGALPSANLDFELDAIVASGPGAGAGTWGTVR